MNKWGISFCSGSVVKVYQRSGSGKFTISEKTYKEMWKEEKKNECK